MNVKIEHIFLAIGIILSTIDIMLLFNGQGKILSFVLFFAFCAKVTVMLAWWRSGKQVRRIRYLQWKSRVHNETKHDWKQEGF